MDFSNLIKNQEQVARTLKNSFEMKRMVHTYLLQGQKGSLKMDAAIYIASLLLCENEGACGKCKECKSLATFNNHKLYMVRPENDSIKVEHVKELERNMSYSSDYNQVFIIDGIDKANISACNKLLKFLEELPDTVYGVLITDNISKVIPTIVSRSQVINFKPIPKDGIFDQLISRGIDADKARVVSELSSNINEAFELSKCNDMEKIINLVIHLNQLMDEGSEGFLYFEEEGKFIFKLDKKKQKMFIDVMIMFQNDKFNYLLNRKKEVIFLNTLEFMNQTMSDESQLEIMKILLKARSRMETNANIEILFTQMFVEIRKAIYEENSRN